MATRLRLSSFEFMTCPRRLSIDYHFNDLGRIFFPLIKGKSSHLNAMRWSCRRNNFVNPNSIICYPRNFYSTKSKLSNRKSKKNFKEHRKGTKDPQLEDAPSFAWENIDYSDGLFKSNSIIISENKTSESASNVSKINCELMRSKLHKEAQIYEKERENSNFTLSNNSENDKKSKLLEQKRLFGDPKAFSEEISENKSKKNITQDQVDVKSSIKPEVKNLLNRIFSSNDSSKKESSGNERYRDDDDDDVIQISKFENQGEKEKSIKSNDQREKREMNKKSRKKVIKNLEDFTGLVDNQNEMHEANFDDSGAISFKKEANISQTAVAKSKGRKKKSSKEKSDQSVESAMLKDKNEQLNGLINDIFSSDSSINNNNNNNNFINDEMEIKALKAKFGDNNNNNNNNTFNRDINLKGYLREKNIPKIDINKVVELKERVGSDNFVKEILDKNGDLKYRKLEQNEYESDFESILHDSVGINEFEKDHKIQSNRDLGDNNNNNNNNNININIETDNTARLDHDENYSSSHLVEREGKVVEVDDVPLEEWVSSIKAKHAKQPKSSKKNYQNYFSDSSSSLPSVVKKKTQNDFAMDLDISSFDPFDNLVTKSKKNKLVSIKSKNKDIRPRGSRLDEMHLNSFEEDDVTSRRLDELGILSVSNQMDLRPRASGPSQPALSFPNAEEKSAYLGLDERDKELLLSSKDGKELQMRYLERFQSHEQIAEAKYQIPEPWDQSIKVTEEQDVNLRRVQQILLLPIYDTQPKISKRDIYTFTRDINEYFTVYPRDHRSYNTFVWSMSMQGEYELACSAIEDLIYNGLEPTIVIYTSLMVGCSVIKSVEKAHETYRRVIEAKIPIDAWFLSCYVNTCVEAGECELAFETYTLYKKHNIKPDQMVFNTLIKACYRDSDPDRAWKVFNHMRTWHHQPDIITLNSMIYVAARTSNAEKAFLMYQEIKNMNITPLSDTFELLFYACLRRKDYYKTAFDLLRQMKVDGYVPTRKSLVNLLGVAAKGGDVPTAEIIFDEIMALPDGAISEYPYSFMMEACSTALRHPKHVKKDKKYRDTCLLIFNRMLSQGIRPTCLSLNALLMNFSKRCLINRALEIFDKFESEYSIVPDVFSYNCIIEMFSKTKLVDRALDNFHLMRSKEIKPNIQTYSILITACANNNMANTGIKLIKEMKSKGLEFTPRSPFIVNFRRKWVSAPDFIREIDKLTGKAYEPVMPWRRKGRIKKIVYGRELTKEERKKSSLYG